MAAQTPPPGQYTPQGIAARRRVAPGSVSRLSASFSLGPQDTSMSLSDVSIMSPTTKGRAAFLSSAEQGHMGMGQVSPRMRSPFLQRNGSRSAPGSEPRFVTRSRSRLGLQKDPHESEMEDEDTEAEEEKEWKMVDQMRIWRHDAMIQHLYETAIFWGDKLLSLTGEANDAFWLAQAHFLTGNYPRAERLLTAPLYRRNDKGKGKADDAVDENGKPVDMRPLATNLPCRYLLAQVLMSQEKFEEALEVVGPSNAFSEETDSARPSDDDGLKVHSSLCYVRGILHLRQSAAMLAKQAFMEALIIDVKNYEAFRQLIDGKLMTPAEEWEFINNLSYRPQLPEEAATFIRLVYVSKLRKDDHMAEIAAARRQLVEKYESMADNSEVLLAKAEELFAKGQWEDCYVITSSILERIPGHTGSLPLHLACMYHIPRLHSTLFLFAHDLVEEEPHQAMTWYAVGLWYLCGKKWGDARRYFSKACLIDQRNGPAWIAFAHSHAWEGEHDQAITAYSTAQRQFPGSHLTYLFIGQEYLQLSQSALAEEHFLAAASLNPSDPLLLNELGVVAYNREDYTTAIDYFERAIAGARNLQGSSVTWSSTHCNMGHALRLQKRYAEARAAYAQAIRLDPLNHTAYASQGMLSQLEGDIRTAIRLYHSALSLSPQDPIATVLLEMAMGEQVDALDPTSLPGLPAAIARADLDPFAVPKGNAAFGPLPVEADPLTLDEAGESRDMSNMTLEMEYTRPMRYPDSTYNESSAMEIEED